MVMVANLYFTINVADIMLTVTPRDECCCNLHISDDATEALEKLFTRGHTATSEPSEISLQSLPS